MSEDLLTDTLEYAKGWVEHMETVHERPDDDWTPIVFALVDAYELHQLLSGSELGSLGDMVQTNKAEPEPGDSGMLMLPLNTDPGQEPLRSILALLFQSVSATQVVVCVSTWQSTDPLSRQKYGQVSNDPTRTEKVLVLGVDKRRTEIWESQIVRSHLPPMLNGWVKLEDGAHSPLTDFFQEVMA